MADARAEEEELEARAAKPVGSIVRPMKLLRALDRAASGAGRSRDKREIGIEAVWSLSTAKPGNGVEQLRDNNVRAPARCARCALARAPLRPQCVVHCTRSSPPPHTSHTRTHLSARSVRRATLYYCGQIETYWQSDGTQPHLINVQFQKKMAVTEMHFYLDHKLDESYTPTKISIRAGNTYHELEEVHVLEVNEPREWQIVRLDTDVVLRTHLLQAAVLAMHQNGRDTHIRQVKVFGPRLAVTKSSQLPPFSTVAMSQFSCIR
jgi:anaphase-promoting complex subunit 10